MTPIWKIPAVQLEGQLIFDSSVINRTLLARFGSGALTPVAPTDLDTCNLMTVIDGALDALINRFYLARDGAEVRSGTYLEKQELRGMDNLSTRPSN